MVKDGIEYEVIKAKEESKINLVFIHGIGFNKVFFTPIAEELKEYNCYLIDLPGHGGSEGCSLSFENYLNAVSDFIREIDNVVVIGHSIGGTIALAVALRRIHTVKAGLIIGGGAESMDYSEELINNDLVNINSFKESIGHTDNEMVLKALEHMESDRVLLNDLKVGMSVNILNSLSNVDIPLTIISGEDDKLYPFEYAEHIHEKIEHSKLLIFKNAGSMLPLVKVHEVADEIRELVGKIN